MHRPARAERLEQQKGQVPIKAGCYQKTLKLHTNSTQIQLYMLNNI